MVKKSTSGERSVWYALAATRILLGFTFIWAFLDKLFGLGYATPVAKAWINGGSPTTGFLKNAGGPFADVFNSLAGQAWVDWLFMAGLLGIGLGLILGIGVRISVVAGSVLLFMMWMASLPLDNNPAIDDHIIYIATLLVIGYGINNQRWSLAGRWQKLPIIKSNTWLQ